MSHHAPIQLASGAAPAEPNELLDIRRSLHAMRVTMKQPADHPYREQALLILRESRSAIDRINGNT
jgi:hypothetical protein